MSHLQDGHDVELPLVPGELDGRLALDRGPGGKNFIGKKPFFVDS